MASFSGIKIPKKKPRLGPKAADEKYLGTEPVEFDASDNIKLHAALNWYNYFFTVAEGKPWLLDYVKANYPKDIYNAIKTAPNWMTPMTICSLARMLMNGVALSEKSMEFLDTRIKENADRARRAPSEENWGPASEEEPEKQVKKEPVNPWKLLMRKVAGIMTMVEEHVDEFFLNRTPFDLYAFLKGENAPAQAAHEISKHFSALRDEMVNFKEDFEGKDYKHTLAFYKQMIADCARFLDSKKATRKPQTVAKPTTEKLVRKVKFKKDDPELKLTSINPTQIVGAKLLVTFHTKHRKLTLYYANDDMGLSVKPESTTIINIDEKRSKSKTLRDPQCIAKDFMGLSGIRAIEKWIDGMPYPFTGIIGRTSEDVLLLKVVK